MTGAIVRLRTLAVRLGFWLGSARRPAARVVLATSHAQTLSGNLAYVAEELASREPAIPVTILAWRQRGGIMGRLEAVVAAARAGYHLAGARAFVVDDYFFPMYVITPRPGTLRLQVWHAAGAFKKFGYSVLDREFGADEAYVRMVAIHGNYSLALVSSMSVAPFYAEAFGQPVELFTSRYGLPRTDLFADPARHERALARIKATYGLPDGRRVVLYAPTFRGATVGKARYDDLLDLRVMHDVLGDDHAVLLKLHPFVRDVLSIPADLTSFAIDASGDPDLNELMLVADVLVTDYSSAMYEFALLGRPIAFLAPDDRAYVDERGFYLDFPSDLPGPVFATTTELAAAIKGDAFDIARVQAFATASFDVVDGRSSARIVDEVILPALRGRPPVDG
ncbi:MAG TPA: CDP-glycerol glycerophosphotransferase family protein [Candidatus Limnocylindrales bacterium]